MGRTAFVYFIAALSLFWEGAVFGGGGGALGGGIVLGAEAGPVHSALNRRPLREGVLQYQPERVVSHVPEVTLLNSSYRRLAYSRERGSENAQRVSISMREVMAVREGKLYKALKRLPFIAVMASWWSNTNPAQTTIISPAHGDSDIRYTIYPVPNQTPNLYVASIPEVITDFNGKLYNGFVLLHPVYDAHERLKVFHMTLVAVRSLQVIAPIFLIRKIACISLWILGCVLPER